jgi:ferrous iron transport protein A
VYRAASDEDAFHFTCQSCGRVIPFQSTFVEPLKQEINQQLGAVVSTLCICAGGLCADCREEDEMMTLDQLTTNQPAIVRRIAGTGAVRRRLMDMGLVKGISIERIKTAPMGDPIEYLVRGYHLSLRKSEAQLVEIDPC